MEEYLLIEDAYVLAVDAFMETAGVREVVATGVEIHDGTWMSSNIRLDEGSTLSGDALHETVRACLREKVWCKLEGARGFFVHLGYDLYMFIGLPDGVEPPAALPYLFIEEAESPYLHDEE
jgi:hypothetical protein